MKNVRLRKHNRDLIKAIGWLYLSHAYSLKDLSSKFGISYSSLKYHSRVHGFFIANYAAIKDARIEGLMFKNGQVIGLVSQLVSLKSEMKKAYLPLWQ